MGLMWDTLESYEIAGNDSRYQFFFQKLGHKERLFKSGILKQSHLISNSNNAEKTLMICTS